MVNSNRGRITYRLGDILGYRGWKLPFLLTGFETYWPYRPVAEERPAIST